MVLLPHHKHSGSTSDTCSFCSCCVTSSMCGRRFLSLADHAARQGDSDSAGRDSVSLAQLTERWRTWQLSNLDYLLQLNMLAGRHAGNRAFAPMLPWVLDLSTPPEPEMDTLTVI
jgi:Beige/BEACH domain